MKKRYLLIPLLLTGALLNAQRPNIIYIMSDDHDALAISAYSDRLIRTPSIDRIARNGILFQNSFVGNSICSPARATLITGQHSHMNGVRDNRTVFDGSRMTLPKLFQQGGYQAAMFGKWHLHSLPTGFDYWQVLPGQGVYYDPRMIGMNGDTFTVNGYATDVITQAAIDWMKEKRDPAKPFLMFLHQKAPHRNWVPSLSWLEKWHNRKIPEPSTLYVDMKGKGKAWQEQRMAILKDMRLCSDLKVDPQYLTGLPGLQPDSDDIRSYNATMARIPEPDRQRMKEIYSERGKLLRERKPGGNELLALKYQWYMQDYLACVSSVDENIGRLLDYLDSSGLAPNTIVVYTSDQGFYLGENGWFDKRFMYDVSMRTPLLISWGNHIRAGSKSRALVQNIDYAPTFLDLAGLPIPDFMQGISFKQLLFSPADSLDRKWLYYHYYEYPWDHQVLPHLGIRGERYKLIYFYSVGEWELYDLLKDPEEQHNLSNFPKYQSLLKKMKSELENQRRIYRDLEPAGIFK